MLPRIIKNNNILFQKYVCYVTMSADVTQRGSRQRRLGELRNSYPPNVIVQMHGRTSSNMYHSNAAKYGGNSLATSHQLYREKLHKLHQIRIDNALKQVKATSASISNSDINSTIKLTHPRCSTAPTRGGDNIQNHRSSWGQISIAGFPKREKPLIRNNAVLPKKAYFTPYNALKNDVIDTSLARISADITAGRLSQPINEHSRLHKTINTVTSYRVASAPLVYGTLRHRPRDIPTLRHNSAIQQKRKQLNFTPDFGERNRASFSRASRRRDIGMFNELIPSRDGLIRLDEGPLGVIGEHCTPSKHQHKETPYRFSGYNLHAKPRPMTPANTEVEQPPINPPPSPRTLCLVPEVKKSANECSCRSVRFSCSDNLIHEYKANEPISAENEVFD